MDNFSGFTNLYLCPNGRKTGQWAVHALQEFRLRFPGTIQKLYTDNGTEFVNSKVLGWCEEAGIRHRTTKPAYAWSNGKAERTQAMLKREVVIPALVERRFGHIAQLQADIEERMVWYNRIRPHFGAINQGLPPFTVAQTCDGLPADVRDQLLARLRKEVRTHNRSQWQKEAAE